MEETLTLHLSKSQHQRAGPDELVWSPSLVRDVLASLTSPALPKTRTSSDSLVSASSGVLPSRFIGGRLPWSWRFWLGKSPAWL